MSRKPCEARVQRDPKTRSRQLRHEATPAEMSLWEILRNRKVAGLKFRRQQRRGGFIADFFCAEIKLVIELDGPVHTHLADWDAARQEALEQGGLIVVRFANAEVIDTPMYVILRIVATAQRLRAKLTPETHAV